MIPIENQNGGGGWPPDLDPLPAALPGLGEYLRRRYTCNVVVNEQLSGLDLLNEVIFVTSRLFMTQGSNGKIRLHNKKPTDNALGLSAFDAGDIIIEVDNVEPWVADTSKLLLIAPHTNDSEVRAVVEAVYPTSQNSITLTSSDDAEIDVTAFSGADGATTPATATIDVVAITADEEYTITIDGTPIVFIPSSGDTTESVAGFLAGAVAGHPAVNRRFAVEWASGSSTVTLTAISGTLELDAALSNAHTAPVANPTDAPVATETASGTLPAGAYRIAYSWFNEQGETMLSPFAVVTIAANKRIAIDTIFTTPTGCNYHWYMSPEAGSNRLRYLTSTDGLAFIIDSLPLLSAPLPPDLNRTGAEVMRVQMSFSDRAEPRANVDGSNVMRGSIEWLIGDRKKTANVIEMDYRESAEDYRLVPLRIRDDEHIAKIQKAVKEEVNGQGIDNYFQAIRIATGLLNEFIDANFFYKWTASREALLLEEGDVVCITDDGAGVYNLPVWIEEIDLAMMGAGLPKATLTGSIFNNRLWDDSPVERRLRPVSEHVFIGAESVDTYDLTHGLVDNLVYGGDQLVHTQ